MKMRELQRIDSRLAVQRELVANAERQYFEAYWRNDGDAEYLYKLWQQAINEYNGMAMLCNAVFGLGIEGVDGR